MSTKNFLVDFHTLLLLFFAGKVYHVFFYLVLFFAYCSLRIYKSDGMNAPAAAIQHVWNVMTMMKKS